MRLKPPLTALLVSRSLVCYKNSGYGVIFCQLTRFPGPCNVSPWLGWLHYTGDEKQWLSLTYGNWQEEHSSGRKSGAGAGSVTTRQ